MSAMLKLVFLGTSAAMPTVKRALTCICLVRDNEILMFDAGEGAQISYLKMGVWCRRQWFFYFPIFDGPINASFTHLLRGVC